MFALLDLCVSSLRRGHANTLWIVPSLTDDPRRESVKIVWLFRAGSKFGGACTLPRREYTVAVFCIRSRPWRHMYIYIYICIVCIYSYAYNRLPARGRANTDKVPRRVLLMTSSAERFVWGLLYNCRCSRCVCVCFNAQCSKLGVSACISISLILEMC